MVLFSIVALCDGLCEPEIELINVIKQRLSLNGAFSMVAPYLGGGGGRKCLSSKS